MKLVSRIFEESTGKYHICDDLLPYLDARGGAYTTKGEALLAAYCAGFTHAVGSGTYRSGATIRSQLSAVAVSMWQREHERAQAYREENLRGGNR